MFIASFFLFYFSHKYFYIYRGLLFTFIMNSRLSFFVSVKEKEKYEEFYVYLKKYC